MVSKRKRVTWEPYGRLVSKVLDHVSFTIEDVESKDNLVGDIN